MAIFIDAKVEPVVQVDDRLRIDVSDTLIPKGETAPTSVKIKPEASGSFIEVYSSKQSEWWLDWVYLTAGSKVVSVEIDNGTVFSKDFAVEVVTSATDSLFSSDQDLFNIEPDLIKYLPKGKSSFLWMHRKAQAEILEQLYKDGFLGSDGEKLTKAEILDVSEVKQWSTYMTLRSIFRFLSNQSDDVFDKKSKEYQNLEHMWRNLAVLKIDIDRSGALDDGESFNMTTRWLNRV